jgi:hypothetical protein
VWNATRLLLAVQGRSGYLHVYAAVAVATVVAVRVLLPDEWRPIVVPAVLLGEYGTMGVFMVGALHHLGRIEGSSSALLVTPLTHREHVAALVLAPALVATPAGILVHGGILGADQRTLALVLPLFLTTCLAGSTGLILASRHAEFTRFLMGSVPLICVFSLPYLSFFGVVPRYTFAWLPWDAALFSFANLSRAAPEKLPFVLLLLELIAFTAAAFLLAERALRAHLVDEAGAA